MNKSRSGFTIVELLIVIVVIAILAAISVVAYTGIQQRATNTAIISAASQTVKAIQAYIAANGAYPYTHTSTNVGCIVPTTGTYTGYCRIPSGIISASGTSSTTIRDNLATIGTLPSSILPASSSIHGGIYFGYAPTRTYNGVTQPLMVSYALIGDNQDCGIANVVDYSGGLVTVSSTTGYSSSSDGYTECGISIAGP